ncbi:MAG TPA: hypothetical protein VEI98_09575 [Xanthobacteraceae bacterium]|nr:hypothetical protein [Xanthobacteraceae bacterium]
MIDKRLLTAATLLGLALGLGSCGQFSGYVADHWPHWAGGLPDDAPPRPGAPGYAEFVAHGQASQDPANSAVSQQAAAAVQTSLQKPSTPPPRLAAPAAQAQAAPPKPVTPAAQAQAVPPPTSARPEDSSVLKGGGLY